MTNINKKITFRLCLLVHNRFEFAKISLNSLLNQSIVDYDVYVSDNSDDLSFSNYVNENCKEYSNLKYIFRKNCLNGIEHINKVIDESIGYDFIMIFHDDDILHYDYFESIIKLKEINDNELAAIAINGLIIKNNLVSNKKITNYSVNTKLYSKPKLIDSYFSFESKGAAPFPGYLYRTSLLKGLRLRPENGGKHSDLSFLCDLLSNGYFLWLNKPLMSYRIHDNNDSKFYSEKDRKMLYDYLCDNHLFTSKAKADFELMIQIEKYNNNVIDKKKFYLLILIYLIKSIVELRFINLAIAKLNKF